MKKIIVWLTFIVLLLSACTGGNNRLYPFRWQSVSPEFDSINIKLEYDFINYENRATLESEVEALRKLSVGNPELAARIAFWECRLNQRLGHPDKAHAYIKKAYSLCDSSKCPYTFYRIRGLLRQFERVSGAEAYHQLDREMRFYQNIDDRPMTAISYINMATDLYHIGDYDRSLDYMHKANKINAELGFGKMVSKNTINIANIEFLRDNKEKGRAILLDLLKSDDLVGDSSAINLIKRNLYAHTGEVEWLFMAYDGVRNDSTRRDLQGLYAALLSQYYFNNGQPDSGIVYSRTAMTCMPYVSDYEHKAIALTAYATDLELRGNIDSALQVYKQIELYTDSANAEMERVEVMRMSNLREVQLAIATERESAHKMKLLYLGIISIVLVLGGIIFFIFYRRYKQGQIASRDTSLELEKGQRHLLALTLAMEEKNNTLHSIVEKIDSLHKEGNIDASGAAKVENLIKMHLAGAEERDSFQRMFITVNPDFVKNLHERWPDLSENYVKLATYIYMGLDNHQIARLLAIRPESVKQARWRLRKQLGLDKDESLNDVIRSLV